MFFFDKLLSGGVEYKASDVHIDVGTAPCMRIDGQLVSINAKKTMPDDASKIFNFLMDNTSTDDAVKLKERLKKNGDVDMIYAISGLARFRVNIFMQRGSYSFSIRVVKNNVPTLDELELPSIVKDITQKKQGLVIVTGATGQGKSTTLAALIDQINKERSCNIITLEEPIEYLHRHDTGRVVQREIPHDAADFYTGLRAALRQDPNVIMVGEMRDPETVITAVTAAETGHLVLSTMHTSSAAQAVERIIDAVPPAYHQQVRAQLSSCLVGVISQQLLPRIDRNGRIAAVEILINTPQVGNLIREQKSNQIQSAIETGKSFGMITMKQSVEDLVRRKKVHPSALERIDEVQMMYGSPKTGMKRLEG